MAPTSTAAIRISVRRELTPTSSQVFDQGKVGRTLRDLERREARWGEDGSTDLRARQSTCSGRYERPVRPGRRRPRARPVLRAPLLRALLPRKRPRAQRADEHTTE